MKSLVSMFASFVVALAPFAAFAEAETQSLPGDERIVVLPYDESDIYTITTKYGYQTSLVFAKDEQIETISLGDRSLWQIIPAGERLFIRPMDDDVITNMTIITNRRSYQFDLKSLPDDSKDKPLYVVRFMYPDHTKSRHKNTHTVENSPFQAAPGFSAMPVDIKPPADAEPKNHRYDYTYSGPDDLAPVKVFDDGHSTIFSYAEIKSPAPQIFVSLPGGETREVPADIRGNDLIVHEIAGKFMLRQPAGTVVVYNETLNPQ